MLLNKGEAIKIKYNGIEVEVKSGERLDVRDFDISVGQTAPIKEIVPKVERQLLKKYPGRFDVVETVDDIKIEKEYRGQIDELKAIVSDLEKKLEAEKKISAMAIKKNSEQAEEINGFGEKEAGYKKQISSLKEKMKEMEEDHDATLKRIRGGK